MDSGALGIIVTAVVGLAGILGTYLVARLQRKSDAERAERERRERYTLARHEMLTSAVSDYVAELRASSIAVALRVRVTRAVQQRLSVDQLMEVLGADADPEVVKALNNPNFNAALRRFQPPNGASPPLDAMTVVRRVAELSSRITVLAGRELHSAVRDAERQATALLLRLQASELRGVMEDISTDGLDSAIEKVEIAAIYELQLLPYGEKASFEELLAQTSREGAEKNM
ncbi:hypothetical protein AA0Y32_02195 [Georgenia phoenicis]|uniref:hypothetical protein n=1 Tax=unclassified Georgenia TaxID=2626815 RepID=UPI0039B0237B